MVKLYRKNISEPWFSLIAVEGRLNKGDWEKIEEGDQIDWYNKEMEPLHQPKRKMRQKNVKLFYPVM